MTQRPRPYPLAGDEGVAAPPGPITAERLIAALGLRPLPGEGGFFRLAYTAPEVIPPAGLPPRYRRAKPFASAILYLLTDRPEGFSALHRLRTDELYHFYLGDPVELLELDEDGGRTTVLGPDVLGDQTVQHAVPAGTWQGSRLLAGGRWALLGATMAPAFDPDDFELGRRADLLERFPRHAERIAALTRDG